MSYDFIFAFQKCFEDSYSSDPEKNNFSKNELTDKIDILKVENCRLRQEVHELRKINNFTDGEYLLLQHYIMHIKQFIVIIENISFQNYKTIRNANSHYDEINDTDVDVNEAFKG